MTILEFTSTSVSRADASSTATGHDVPFDRDRLSERLAELARKYRVPGAQLAVHQGGETAALQVGKQCCGTGLAVGADAAFPVGSLSKTYTATLAMVLVADGDIELDAPLREYLSELPEPGSALTLRQLLSHTSGLVADPDDQQELGASIRRYASEHCHAENLVQPPGTAFSYSNLGYVLVGRLIEAITGMTWWEAMESILLRPLGIEPAFVAGTGDGEQERALVTGHSVNVSAGRTRPVAQTLAAARAPAGGLAASALDLVALGRIHLDDEGTAALLSDVDARQMREAAPAAEPFGIADGWGLGLALFRNGHAGGTVSVGHDGNAEGTACYLRVEPSTGCVVAFTSNATTGLAMWRELAADLRAARLPAYGSPGTVTGRHGTALPECAGSYRNGDAEYVVDLTTDGGMELRVDGEPLARLACHEAAGDGRTVLFSQQDLESGEWLPPGRFLRDPATGEVDRIQVDGRIARRRPTPSPDRC